MITKEPSPNTATPATDRRILLLKPRGFCAGVVRAIDVVQIALETFGAPIYVRREIVHNRFVVNDLAAKGAIFVHDIDEVPEGARVIYSAHGSFAGGSGDQPAAKIEGDRRYMSAGNQGARGSREICPAGIFPGADWPSRSR